MSQITRDEIKRLRITILELIEIIHQYQRLQVLPKTAFDYATFDVTRNCSEEKMLESACELLSIYDEKIEDLDEKANEIINEAKQFPMS